MSFSNFYVRVMLATQNDLEVSSLFSERVCVIILRSFFFFFRERYTGIFTGEIR